MGRRIDKGREKQKQNILLVMRKWYMGQDKGLTASAFEGWRKDLERARRSKKTLAHFARKFITSSKDLTKVVFQNWFGLVVLAREVERGREEMEKAQLSMAKEHEARERERQVEKEKMKMA